MLNKRLITSAVGLPVVIAALWFGHPWFTILLALCGLAASIEFYRMATRSHATPLIVFGTVLILCFIIYPVWEYDWLVPALLTISVIAPLIYLVLRPRPESFFSWAWTLAGILYIGWLLSHYTSLALLDNSRGWLFLTLFSTFGCDTCAYIVGKLIGRHHLAPRISPGKTWEGAIGGIAGSICVSLLMGWLFTLPVSPAHLALLGLLVGIAGQFGDLAESALKRNSGVKDAGKLIPGHGGILDRLDSVVFTGPVVYYYLVWILL